MNKLFLKLAMLPSGLWRRMGADTAQLNAILDVRLKMDDRRPLGFGRQRAQKKERKHVTILSMVMSLLVGIIYMLPILVVNDTLFALTIFFSFLIFFLTLTLITDFSNVLFDTRDKFILFPRPVGDKTIVLSRLLHVFIYLLRLVLPLAAPGWVALGYSKGWPIAVLFPFVLILMVFMTLFFVMGCYLLLLKLVTPSRFKDVINYFQIAVSIVFVATYYLLPRLFDADKGFTISITSYPWVKWIPSYWLASCFTWVGLPALLAGTKIVSVLAILFPLACFWVMIKWLAPQFTRSIGGIDAAEMTESKKVRNVSSGGKLKMYQKLARLLNRSELAIAGFTITWLQTSRSRSFKMRVYPTFAFIPIYFVYFVFNNRMPVKDAMHSMTSGYSYLFLLYLCSFAMMQAVNYVAISDQYKASWIYYAAPVETPGHIMAGAFKAMWIKFFLPFFVAISIAVVSIWGIKTLPDILLALVNVTLFATIIMRVAVRYLPFSQLEQMKQSGNRILKAFVAMIIPLSFGFAHFLAVHILWLKLLFVVLSAILLWLVWDSYRGTSWSAVIKTEFE